jgi:hypothetical protein
MMSKNHAIERRTRPKAGLRAGRHLALTTAASVLVIGSAGTTAGTAGFIGTAGFGGTAGFPGTAGLVGPADPTGTTGLGDTVGTADLTGFAGAAVPPGFRIAKYGVTNYVANLGPTGQGLTAGAPAGLTTRDSARLHVVLLAATAGSARGRSHTLAASGGQPAPGTPGAPATGGNYSVNYFSGPGFTLTYDPQSGSITVGLGFGKQFSFSVNDLPPSVADAFGVPE